MANSSTWQIHLEDVTQYNRTFTGHLLNSLVDQAFDILETFVNNPAKQLANYAASLTDDQANGVPTVKRAPFVPTQDEREQMKDLCQSELGKQWAYTLMEINRMHKMIFTQLGFRFTQPNISCKLIHDQMEVIREDFDITDTDLKVARKIYRRLFRNLMDEYLDETKANMKNTLENIVRNGVNGEGTTEPLLTFDQFNDFVNSNTSENALEKSGGAFMDATAALNKNIVQLFNEMNKQMICDRHKQNLN